MLTGNTSKYFPIANAKGKHDFRDRDLLFDTMADALDKGSAIFAGAAKDDFEKRDFRDLSSQPRLYRAVR